MIKNEKLKEISDLVLQEVNPPADRKRPLEWRRSFNRINLEVTDLKIITSARLNDLKFSFLSDKDQNKDSFTEIKADLKSIRSINGLSKSHEDRIYYAIEEDKEEKIFSFQKPNNPIRISLEDCGKNIRKDDLFPNGLYEGVLFYDEYEDQFSLQVNIPTLEFDKIQKSLEVSPSPVLNIQIALLSFSFEVDDAFRGYGMPRDLLMAFKTSTLAPLLQVSIISSVDQKISVSKNENDLLYVVSCRKIMRKIATPLWAIAIFLFLILISGR